MRVTDRMLFDRAARDGGAARSRLEKATGVASTGAKLIHPGDDPSGAGLVTRHRAVAAQAAAVTAAAGQAADELQVVDSALDAVSSALARAREVAMQFSSAGYDAAARATAGAEVASLLDTIRAALNGKVGDRYVMGGRSDGAPPFDASGAYLGDHLVREVEVAPGVWQAASVQAGRALKGATVGAPGVDVLDSLARLRTALQANDQAGTAAVLGDVAAATDQVATLRGQVGIAMASFDTAVAVNRLARDDATTLAAHLTDADAIQAATELALAQRGLEASLTATAKSFRLSLLDYLK